MKKFKIILITLLAMILLVALPLTACDNGGTTGGGNTNQSGGTGNETPGEKDPEKDPIKDPTGENDPEKGDDSDDPTPGTDPEEDPWAGEWKSLDGSLAFSIAADGVHVIENDTKTAATRSLSDDDATLTLTTAEKEYSLSRYEGFVANKILILTADGEKSYFIPAANEIDSSFNGTWYDLLGTNVLTVDTAAGTASFNDETALAVVDCGLVATLENNDGSMATVNHNCLYLIMEDGGDIYFVGWYKDDTSAGQDNGRAFDCPEVTTTETCATPLTHRPFCELYVDEDLDGTWRNLKGDVTIEVDATTGTVKVGGKSAEVYNNGGTRGAGNIIVSGGQAYRLEPDPGYNYFLTRETIVDLGMGRRDYFLKSDHEFGKVDNTNLQGTEWQDLAKTHKLTIDAEGNIKYDNKAYTVFVAELLSTLTYKVIAVSADNYKLELSFASGDGYIVFSDGFTEVRYYKDSGSTSTETGFLGLPVGVITNAEGKQVQVTADSLIIKVKTFGYFDDEDIVVTMDTLTEADPVYGSSKSYTFTWTDVTNDGKEHEMRIALDVTASWAGGSFTFMVAFSENDENFFLQK